MECEDPSMQDSPRLTPVLPVKNQQTQLPPSKTHRTDTNTLPLQLFCSHLIFFPFSATLVLLRIPAFSSRCPCRNADTQLSPQVTCFEMWLLCKQGSGESLMKGLLSACFISSISLIGAGNIFKYLKIFPGTKLKDLCDYSRTKHSRWTEDLLTDTNEASRDLFASLIKTWLNFSSDKGGVCFQETQEGLYYHVKQSFSTAAIFTVCYSCINQGWALKLPLPSCCWCSLLCEAVSWCSTPVPSTW